MLHKRHTMSCVSDPRLGESASRRIPPPPATHAPILQCRTCLHEFSKQIAAGLRQSLHRARTASARKGRDSHKNSITYVTVRVPENILAAAYTARHTDMSYVMCVCPLVSCIIRRYICHHRSYFLCIKDTTVLVSIICTITSTRCTHGSKACSMIRDSTSTCLVSYLCAYGVSAFRLGSATPPRVPRFEVASMPQARSLSAPQPPNQATYSTL